MRTDSSLFLECASRPETQGSVAAQLKRGLQTAGDLERNLGTALFESTVR